MRKRKLLQRTKTVPVPLAASVPSQVLLRDLSGVVPAPSRLRGVSVSGCRVWKLVLSRSLGLEMNPSRCFSALHGDADL